MDGVIEDNSVFRTPARPWQVHFLMFELAAPVGCAFVSNFIDLVIVVIRLVHGHNLSPRIRVPHLNWVFFLRVLGITDYHGDEGTTFRVLTFAIPVAA
jgi:hypothetical protein